MRPGPIAQAREQLAALAPSLNDYWHGQLHSEIERASAAAVVLANGHADGRFTEAMEVGRAAVESLCDVRDKLRAIASAGESGQLTATEFRAQLLDLARIQTSASSRLAEFEHLAEVVESVEDDPEAFADDLYARFPNVAPELAVLSWA